MNTTPNGRKRVLLMVTKSNFGGAQRYIHDLAVSLPKDSFDVAVAAGGHGSLFEKCSEQRIRTVRLPHLDRDISMFKEIKAFFALVGILRKERPDIVHLNSPKMGGLGGLAARIAGIKKIIYTNHGWSFHENRPWWQRIFIKVFSWKIVMLSTKTIVLSEKEKRDVSNWPFVKNKLTVVPNGIASPNFLEKSEARKKLLEFAHVEDTDQELILSIGELTKNKGYEYALKALKDYGTPHAYVIIGTGESRKDLSSESGAHIVGFVPDAAKYIKGADIFLLPSIKEGLPYVLLEAGYAGVPVISTNVGGISDLAGNQRNQLITPRDPQGIKNALENKTFFYPLRLHLEDMVNKTIAVYN